MGRLWPVREKKRTFFFPNHDGEQGNAAGQSCQWIALSAPGNTARAELSMDRAFCSPAIPPGRVINGSRFDENGPVQLVGVEARAVGNSLLSHGSPPAESQRELLVTRCFLAGVPSLEGSLLSEAEP